MNPLQKMAEAALARERNMVVFLGPGVCRDAGIHTGWDLMLKTAGLIYIAETDTIDPALNLSEWFSSSKYARMNYMELLSKIAPSKEAQVSFVKNYLDSKATGEIYKLIANLATRKMLVAIITVNFDHYLERAIETHREQMKIIASDSDLDDLPPLKHTNDIRIYKPYGDIERGSMRLTPADMEHLPPAIEKELIEMISENSLVLLGYSGYHDTAMQNVFKSRGFSYAPLFYVNPNPPAGEMKDILRTKDYTFIRSNATQCILDFIHQLEQA